jgi:homoserine O-acetyltransferase
MTVETRATAEVRARAPAPPLHKATVQPATAQPVTALPLGTGRLESASLGSFDLASGVVLPDLTVAYRHDGPGPDRAPQILVIHALTGSADAAGDWWAPLIGPGRAFDTDRYGVICANLLGGCYGTTGPTSVDPSTGAPYGERFPDVTAGDQARAQWRLLDALGVDRLALATGGSLGGMVALEVALARPSAIGAIVPIAAPAATGPLAIAWNHLQLELIDELGDDGLRWARQLAMTTYRSEADFGERFGRRVEPDGRPAVVSYLAYQGDKLLDRFDRHTYRVLVRAMDSHDIGRDRGDVVAALGPLGAAGVRLVGFGIAGDILYGPEQVRALVESAERAGLRASYREIESTKGHDAFLVEWPQLTVLLREVLVGG